MFLPREALGSVKSLLGQFPVAAVLGARQVGKSTLVSFLGSEWRHFDLERGQDLDVVGRDPDLFFARHARKVIIDEAQELPALFRALRVAVDRERTEKGRFVITISSSPALLSSISETLAGRVGLLELGTLKASERWARGASGFYRAVEANIDHAALEKLEPRLSRQELFHSWFHGGYPEAVLLRDEKEFRLWMDNYRLTYLQRDVRRLFPRLEIEAFRRFLSMLSRLSGTIVNHSELARALGVSQPTVRQYVDIAHGTFLWRKLAPYTRNVEKRATKMPRGHLRDSGLLHFLLNLGSEEALMQDPIVGRSWEAFVTEEVLKGFGYALVPHEAYYYRSRHGSEVDLIVEGHFGTLPIEVKLGTTVDQRSLRGLRDFVEEEGLKLGIVINNADSVAWLSDKILRIPATVL
jgi:predicted AAA+ superfamily ATPase